MEVSTISNDPIHTSAIANLDRICGRKFTTIDEDSQKTICSKNHYVFRQSEQLSYIQIFGQFSVIYKHFFSFL